MRSWSRSGGRATALLASFAVCGLLAAEVVAKPPPPKKPPPKPPASTSASAPPAPPPPEPSTTAPAASASATTNTDEAEAKRHFEIGLKLYKEKVYDAALTEFEMSYKLAARASALRNIAQCHRDLKHFAEAHDTYERLLAVHGTQLAAKEKEAILRALADLKLLTGTIALTVNEADATVLVDGKSVGVTPLAAPIRVDVGSHVLRVTKTGYEPAEESVKIVAQQAATLDLKINKEVKTGKLTVKEKNGADVRVFVDDVDVGTAPWTGDVAPGSHWVELKGPTLASPRRTIEVALKGNAELTLEATPLRGRLRIETLNKQGDIFVDGKKVGTGTWEDDVVPGTHEIKIVAPGFETYTHLVAVQQGQKVVEPVTLVPTSGNVTGPVKDPYKGLYGRFQFMGALALSGPGHEIAPACTDKPACDHGNPIGAGVGLQIGYAFGIVGVELVGAFLADYHQSKRTFTGRPGDPGYPTTTGASVGTAARSETYDYLGFAGFAGIGGRVTSKDDAVRFTFGMSLGGIYRHINFKRSTLDDGWKPPAVGALSPGLLFDGGILLGATPGNKMTLGVMMWIDFASTMTTEGSEPRNAILESTGRPPLGVKIDSPPQTLRSGTQVYIGPTLGIQFGR